MAKIVKFREENPDKTFLLNDEECSTLLNKGIVYEDVPLFIEPISTYKIIPNKVLNVGDWVIVNKPQKVNWRWKPKMDEYDGKEYQIKRISYSWDWNSQAYSLGIGFSFMRSWLKAIEYTNGNAPDVPIKEDEIKPPEGYKIVPNKELKVGDKVLVQTNSYYNKKANGKVYTIYYINQDYYGNRHRLKSKSGSIFGNWFLRKELKALEPIERDTLKKVKETEVIQFKKNDIVQFTKLGKKKFTPAFSIDTIYYIYGISFNAFSNKISYINLMPANSKNVSKITTDNFPYNKAVSITINDYQMVGKDINKTIVKVQKKEKTTEIKKKIVNDPVIKKGKPRKAVKKAVKKIKKVKLVEDLFTF